MAYIEREKAIDKILSLKTSGAFTQAFKNAVLQTLEQEPAADVVEVVRCKDCKYCDPDNRHFDHYMVTVFPVSREYNDFCSYGERKDGE